MTRKAALFFFVVCFLLTASAAGAQFHAPQVAGKESGFQQIRFIESGNVLYNYRWTSARSEENGRTVVTVYRAGRQDAGEQP